MYVCVYFPFLVMQICWQSEINVIIVFLTFDLNSDSRYFDDHIAQSAKTHFDTSAAESIFELIRPAMNEKRSIHQAMRTDLREILDKLFEKLELPDNPSIQQNVQSIKNAMETPLLKNSESSYPWSAPVIVLLPVSCSRMYVELYSMEADYLFHQPSVSKSFETGRWDRRLASLQRAQQLLIWSSAIEMKGNEWMRLGDQNAAIADAILYAGPLKILQDWSLLIESLVVSKQNKTIEIVNSRIIEI